MFVWPEILPEWTNISSAHILHSLKRSNFKSLDTPLPSCIAGVNQTLEGVCVISDAIMLQI